MLRGLPSRKTEPRRRHEHRQHSICRRPTRALAATNGIIYLKEAKYEFLKNLRLRMYTASVLSFPIMFYVLFGLVLNAKEAIGVTRVPTYLISTYGTFGVMGASLFGSGLTSRRNG